MLYLETLISISSCHISTGYCGATHDDVTFLLRETCDEVAVLSTEGSDFVIMAQVLRETHEKRILWPIFVLKIC